MTGVKCPESIVLESIVLESIVLESNVGQPRITTNITDGKSVRWKAIGKCLAVGPNTIINNKQKMHCLHKRLA